MGRIYRPTTARAHFFELMKKANSDGKPVRVISQKSGEKGVVMIGEDDWNSIEETLYLVNTGVLDQISKRKDDPAENFDDVWNRL